MGLQAEIAKMLGCEDPARVAYTVSGTGGHFRFVKRVAEFSAERIVLRGKRGSLAVEGRGLSLERCEGGDVFVKGEVVRVEAEP